MKIFHIILPKMSMFAENSQINRSKIAGYAAESFMRVRLHLSRSVISVTDRHPRYQNLHNQRCGHFDPG